MGREASGERDTYLLDLTKAYHNLLSINGKDKNQTFYWDNNVAAMEEGGDGLQELHYYLQDELGSPLRVSTTDGYLTYGYDEFGNDLGEELEREGIPNPYAEQREGQPFGYTGYRYDNISNTYFAQAREYKPESGRFTAEDVIKGNGAVSITLNQYGYCFHNPLTLTDKAGNYPDSNIYTPIGEKLGEFMTDVGESIGEATGEIMSVMGNTVEQLYDTAGSAVQDISCAVGTMTQEIGAIMGGSQSVHFTGAAIMYTGDYMGNALKSFGAEAGEFMESAGTYMENDIKSTTATYGGAIKTVVRDENVRGTYTNGISISASLTGVFAVDISFAYSIDLKGNFAIQMTESAGITSSSDSGLSFSAFKTKTNALDIYKLEKKGASVGGSLPFLTPWTMVSLGMDFVIVGDLNKKAMGIHLQ